MANIRRIDLGAPPSSVVPVYQDVYAAGAVGRAAMSVGEGIRDLGRSLANVNQRKQALAGDATEANFIEGKAKLEAQIKEYQAKIPPTTTACVSLQTMGRLSCWQTWPTLQSAKGLPRRGSRRCGLAQMRSSLA